MRKIDLLAHSHLWKEWDEEQNHGVDPRCVNSSHNAWWKCPKSTDHKWQALVSYRIKGGGCFSCANRKVVMSNCLATIHPEVSKQWNDELNEISPSDVTAGSNKSVWWKCPVAEDHVWKFGIADRIRRKTKCPFCIGKRASSTNNLELHFPEIAKEWDCKKNGCLPSSVPFGSAKKMWWKCLVNDEHSWQTTVNNRTSKGHPCPYCAGKKADSKTSLLALYPELCEEWDDEFSPNGILPNSHKRCWWKCSKEHRWQAKPNARVSAASGCPMCNESGGEKLVARILSDMGIVFSRQYRFPDCKRKRSLPFDFAVHGDRLGLIEFHGHQHYFPVKIFGGEKKYRVVVASDKIKTEYCKGKSIPLLVISYRESKNIKELLQNFVESLP